MVAEESRGKVGNKTRINVALRVMVFLTLRAWGWQKGSRQEEAKEAVWGR